MRFTPAAILCFLILSPALALDRENWLTSRVTGTPEAPAPLKVQRIYPDLQFNNPVEMVPLPGTGKMLLAEVGGKVFALEDDEASDERQLLLDLKPIRDKFSRLYGITPHPDFENNREVYLVYCLNPVARPDGTRLSRFKIPKGGLAIDPASEEVLLTWHSGGHNGSCIRFDADGYLYFSAGDGAKPYPPDEYNVGQNLSDLRSTICRIDVSRRQGDLPYGIPPDNPFLKTPGARPEIWAYGFRNPWRMSIDRETGQLMVGDVGWELWELVFHVERAGNYGWSIFEGPQPIRSDLETGPTPIRKPLVAYPHTEGLSVTGGFIYHGQQFPELQGAYLYGDYVTGKLWAMRFDGTELMSNEVVAETGLKIISFTESRDGEVIVMNYGGTIHKLVRNEAAGKPSQFPRALSETGLFADTPSLQPAAGVYEYQLTRTAFADGATSQFHVAVPDGAEIRGARVRRAWNYPVGTVFVKTLSANVLAGDQPQPRKIETQLLHYNGSAWAAYSYRWNDSQTDATLVDAAGLEVAMPLAGGRQSWVFQSRSECQACHTMQTGGAVGFDYSNLSGPSLLDPSRDQNEVFFELGLLKPRPPESWNVKHLVAPDDQAATLEDHARSYLAVNCAHCHRRGGGGTVALELTYSNKTEDIFAVDFPATQGTFGLGDAARVIVPGDPYHSVLYYRMATSGMGHMPKIWRRDNDTEGLQLIHDWIRSMADKPASSQASQLAGSVSSPVEALRWMSRIEAGKVDGEQKQRLVSAALSEGDKIVKGLFERYISPDKRVERLGNKVDPDAILALTGDASRGRDQFLHSAVLSCRSCHQLGDAGSAFGPKLDGIGAKRKPAELLDSILNPSAAIDPQFAACAVLMLDGRVITGLRDSQDDDSVVLRVRSTIDGSSKPEKILMDDVDDIVVQKKSLMPEGLYADMTAQELADLLAFLVSLQ